MLFKMATLSNERLRESIAEILRDADLNSLSSKKVRLTLEEKHDIDLSDRKKELDNMIMKMISQSQSSGQSGDTEDERKSRSTAVNGTSEQSASESDNDEGDSDEEYSPKKKKMKGAAGKPVKPKKGKSKNSSDEGDDDDEDGDNEDKDEAKKGKGKGGSRKGKSTYSKKCILSPELAEVVGATEMARHEVVKKMWQIVKERNLADPKNKQFAVCDDQLLKVFGVKRFRTFGMMKFLKSHIKDPR